MGITVNVSRTPVTVAQLREHSDSGKVLRRITIRDLGLEHHDLRDCVLINMTLKNCNIVSCDLDGCIVTNTSQPRCPCCFRTLGKEISIWRSSLESCTLQNANVNHSKFSAMVITSTRVEVGRMYDSEITNSMLSNMYLYHSYLKDSLLYNADTRFNGIGTSSQTTISPLALRRFPTDIRILIFEEVFKDSELVDQDGYPVLREDHVLIKALRGGDLEIYFEALVVMSKICTFMLRPNQH